MSRRRIIILLLGGSLLLLATVLLFLGDREPSYNGRPLSWWVESYAETRDPLEAEAIHQIGKNAIPFLLNWIQLAPQSDGRTWPAPIDKVIVWVRIKFNANGMWTIRDRQNRAFAAAVAFKALGTQANQAVPDLTNLLNNGTNYSSAHVAAEALSQLGEAGVPPLLAALKGTNAHLHFSVLQKVRRLGTNAQPMVPQIIHILGTGNDLNSEMAARALQALGRLSIEPDSVVPALIKELARRETISSLRMQFRRSQNPALALASYRSLARPAIPVFTNWLSGENVRKQMIASNALHMIDPQVFTNATYWPIIPSDD